MSETLLTNFFQGTGLPLAVLDSQGTFVALNDGWKSVLKDPKAVQGQRFEDIFTSEDAVRARDSVGRIRPATPQIFDARIAGGVTGSNDRLMHYYATGGPEGQGLRQATDGVPGTSRCLLNAFPWSFWAGVTSSRQTCRRECRESTL